MSGPGRPNFGPPPGAMPSGGGSMSEQLDEQTLQQLMGGQASSTSAAGSPHPTQLASGPSTPPRELGTLADELVQRPVQDVYKGLQTLLDFRSVLGIKTEDDPATKQRKQLIWQNFNNLTQEQQQEAQVRLQAETERREQQKMMQQRAAQQAAQPVDIVAPSGSKKGPQGPGGSKKQRAVTKLQNDRKTLNGPQSAN